MIVHQVMDLLNANQRRNLAVRWSKNKGFYVENLFHVECESVDDLLAVLEEGECLYMVTSLWFCSHGHRGMLRAGDVRYKSTSVFLYHFRLQLHAGA